MRLTPRNGAPSPTRPNYGFDRTFLRKNVLVQRNSYEFIANSTAKKLVSTAQARGIQVCDFEPRGASSEPKSEVPKTR